MRARDNPFAVHRVLRVRYRLTEAGWDRLLGRLAALRYRGAIVGEKGRGKTTLLEDLGERLSERGFRVRLLTVPRGGRELSADQKRALSTLGSADLLLLDAAEELSRSGWRQVEHATRNAAGLVVTAHRTKRLATLLRLETTPELLGEIIGALAGPVLSRRLPSAGELYARHAGNVRTALRELYDYCAARTGSELAST